MDNDTDISVQTEKKWIAQGKMWQKNFLGDNLMQKEFFMLFTFFSARLKWIIF